MRTTLEEASLCPKCGEPGMFLQENKNVPKLRPGSTVRFYRCDNERCPTYGQGIIVQVNPDGTIPTRSTKGPKQFPALPDDAGRTEQRLRAEVAQSQRPGGYEVR
jgi:hypothetical protein